MVIIMNKIKSILIMSILLASIFALLSPVSAATYHVYPGDDIEAIIEGATSGDTIYVHAGTHYPTRTITVSGHPSIIGDSPSNTIIDFNNIGGGIDASSQDGFTIKNITVKNSAGHGILVDDECLVENCIVYGCGGDGFRVDEESTLKNCLSYDNVDDGFNDEEGCTYINCTAANNGGSGFYSEDGEDTLVNCIAVGNKDDGFDIWNSDSEILYSNAWGNSDVQYQGTSPGTGSISVDPFFMKGPLGDFYLFKSSPCVNKGSDSAINLGLSTGFTTNVKGAFDTGTVDMGYHYSSNGGSDSSLPIAKILEIIKSNQ
ncbi:MAG: hypothetical protein AMQ22_00550 [Candidatus Methanofastidiosum methylothiophilum]|uniref:Right handed beta helix domain-containing protein n=1 Tax=Candidatus Methanofastidiosum methylothiophilum TaxID=1705564 RepID=A0A150J6V5_9EURY|nr:MAG: hypothetical protein AMQ22_00550 [Candidatus Methanofastidiosum methylthiophilus]